MLVCPHCLAVAVDNDFCAHCRRPLAAATGLPEQVLLADGRAVDCAAWRGLWPAEPWRGRLVVTDGRPCRVYALSPGWWRRLGDAVRARAAVTLEGLAPVEVVPAGDGTVVVAAALADARLAVDLMPAPGQEEGERLQGTLQACRTLAAAARPLHEAGFVWLNFDPGALETDGARLQITNLDLTLFRFGACPEWLPLSPAYSPPEACRLQGEQVGPPTDVFALSLFAYYHLAGLLTRGFPGLGLEAFDFDVPPLRVYRPRLPTGVAPALARGYARDPAARFASVDDWLGALEGAAERGRGDGRPLTWEVGAVSVTGRLKEAQGKPNQDAFWVADDPAWGLAAVVADGVSHARVGCGELASSTACRVLAEFLPRWLARAPTAELLEEVLRAGCRQASRAVLEQALALGPPPEGADLTDLMSTTAVLAVLRGGTLTLAAVGDSRAYLLTPRGGGAFEAEQLTVDGDVSSALLAAGAAPERVRELGPDGGALASCLGVAEVAPSGELRCADERCSPGVTHWPLRPGDVVLLCSDGLVEEGIFLAPDEAAGVVAGAAGRSAQDVAEALAAAAGARQRLPTPEEPEGSGDNVTCVVIRVTGRAEG